MATLQSARAKYDRKAASMSANYNAAKGRMKANWVAGMSEFLGGPVAPHRASNYNAGIDAAQHRSNGAKWERNMRVSMTGG